jgi:hypothetical protein
MRDTKDITPEWVQANPAQAAAMLRTVIENSLRLQSEKEQIQKELIECQVYRSWTENPGDMCQ